MEILGAGRFLPNRDQLSEWRIFESRILRAQVDSWRPRLNFRDALSSRFESLFTLRISMHQLKAQRLNYRLGGTKVQSEFVAPELDPNDRLFRQYKFLNRICQLQLPIPPRLGFRQRVEKPSHKRLVRGLVLLKLFSVIVSS